jgi:hypothetical protein
MHQYLCRHSVAANRVMSAVLVSFLMLFCSLGQAGADSCDSASNCNQAGTELLGKGEVSRAIELFKLQVGYAEGEEDRSTWTIGYNNLAVAYMHGQNYFAALAWTKAALHFDPNNEAATFNLAKIREHIGNTPWPTQIGGTYVRYAGHAAWSSLCVSPNGGKSRDFALDISRSGGESSVGNVDGKAALIGGTVAKYSGDSDFPTCHIDMAFEPNSVTLKQRGDCGFGYGVQAVGDYYRISPNGDKDCGERLP